MRTIGVVARKGGAGKTTIAVQLALAWRGAGRHTLVADADPQRSAITVLQARRQGAPELAATTGRKLYPLQMNAVRGGVERLVIDTPSVLHDEMISVVALADVCLLVARPTFLDLADAAQTLGMIRVLRKPVFVVLSQAPAARLGVESPVVTKAQEALDAARAAVCPVIVRARMSYQRAMETGAAAAETGDASAAREIADLVAFLDRADPGGRAWPAFA
jgi:chromosome partitioning protein